ncbi:MAG: FKBP-type peptidyl-prolyl cis-trans isomerase [Bacteroidales bacterium]|uniref:FKBP-type peptidyl-prolyl cis-trans isomerase n=1 Tax=Sodaliphilus sp. TaxID=2815818 RepID=UPI001B54E7DF|nr:FKBP-type peptidyl-prolyl cis-trans isomerase [Candidatus Sodaliphilus limicaballi]
MAKNKEEYRFENEMFMVARADMDGVKSLEGGVLYEVLGEGTGQGTVTPRSVVTCHYRGSLIDGSVFDDSWERGCPEAFRVNDLITGFTTALCHMHKGDHWMVYIPWQQGYGKRSIPGIPGCSTLVFEIELIGIS